MINRKIVTSVLGNHSIRKYRVLEQLSNSGPMNVRRLARKLGSATGLTKILKEMEGFVTVEEKGKERICSLTRNGSEMYREILEYSDLRKEGGFFYKDRENGTISEMWWWNPKYHRMEQLKSSRSA